VAILNNVAMVVSAFKDRVSEVLPGVTPIFDPNLDFHSSKELARTDYNYSTPEDRKNKSKLPYLIYNRSVLNPSDTIGLRGPRKVFTPHTNITLDVDVYKVRHSSFTVQFLYAANSISKIEEFEILYNTRQGLHGLWDFKLDLTPAKLGVWEYFIDWDDTLQNMTTNIDGNQVKSILGVASIRGFFITVIGKAPVIRDIYVSMYGSNTNDVLDSLHIQLPIE
jgi:hypothetical protein